ncbi:unnamed protein product [Lymnaea stagnalis]|uniref:Uncharacterized protein n=1 Tax=Lymnaea stagnalis TaxID=6523 RepID=A0AAV2HHP8_LYMST
MDHRQALLLLVHMVVVMTGAAKSEPTLSDLLQVRCPSDHPFMCLPYGTCCRGSEFCHSGLCESCFPRDVPESQLLSWCRDVGQHNVSLMRSEACRLACQDKFSSAELAVTCGTTRAQKDENVSAPSYSGARSGDDVTECQCTAYMAVMITSVLISVALVVLMIFTRLRKRRSVAKTRGVYKKIYKGKENEIKQKKQGSTITTQNEVDKPAQMITKSTQKTMASNGDKSQSRTNNKLALLGRGSGETESVKIGERRLSKSEVQEFNQSNHIPVSKMASTSQSSVPPANETDDHTPNTPEAVMEGALETDVVVNVDMETKSRGLEFQSENKRVSTVQPTSDVEHETSSGCDVEHETSSECDEAETNASSVVQSSLKIQMRSGSTEGVDFKRDDVTGPEAMAVTGPGHNGGVSAPQAIAVTGDGPLNNGAHPEGDETVQEPSATMPPFEDNPSSDVVDDKGEERELLNGDGMPSDIYNETVDLNRKKSLKENRTAGGAGRRHQSY